MISQQIQNIASELCSGNNLVWAIASGACFPRESSKGMGKKADVFHQQLLLESYHSFFANHMLSAVIMYSLLLLS